MAEIAIYVRNLKLNPSGYYRIGQYLESFHNYKIREACHDKVVKNPHAFDNNDVVGVHNGIIENYQELKKSY